MKDVGNDSKWNSTVNKSSKINSNKFQLEGNLGEVECNIIKIEQNKIIIINISGDIFILMGYKLNPIFIPLPFKGFLQIPSYGWSLIKPPKIATEVFFWIEYDNKEDKNIIEETGVIILNSLKKYSEYLERGHDLDDYIKEEMQTILLI